MSEFLPIAMEDKVDSPALLAFLQQFGEQNYLSAAEINNIRDAINELDSERQKTSEKGQANGYASLDGTGKVPSAQLPSYVDDVLEVANFAALPGTGESGKIYVTIDNSKQYRWSGSAYVVFNGGVTRVLKTVVSTDLTTQDTHGLAVYINALAVSFLLSGNELCTYKVTDTGQVFNLLLNGRSFGGSEPDISETDIIEISSSKTIYQARWRDSTFQNLNAISGPFSGAAINSGGFTAWYNHVDSALLHPKLQGYTLFHTGGAGSNKGYRFRDGVDCIESHPTGLTFFAIVAPKTITDCICKMGFPNTGAFTANAAITSGIVFEITNNALVGKTMTSGLTTSGSSVTVAASEWLMLMIEVESNVTGDKRVRFKARKLSDNSIIYNEVLTTNIPSGAGSSQHGVGIIATKGTSSGTEYITALAFAGYGTEKPHWLKSF